MSVAEQHGQRKIAVRMQTHRRLDQLAMFARGGRHDEVCLSDLVMQAARGLHENFRQRREPGTALPRQQGDNASAMWQAQLCARSSLVDLEWQAVGQGMADVRRANASVFVNCRLERKQGKYAVNAMRNALHLPASPGPDFRPRVLQGRDSGRLQPPPDGQAEFGRTDADE